MRKILLSVKVKYFVSLTNLSYRVLLAVEKRLFLFFWTTTNQKLVIYEMLQNNNDNKFVQEKKNINYEEHALINTLIF